MDWKIARLGDYCHKPEYGLTTSATDKPTGVKFLRITDIQEQGVDWLDVPNCECNDANKARYLLGAGDVVIARIGATTGKAFVLGDCPTAVFASYLIRIKTTARLLPDFLGFFTETESYWKQIDQNKGGRLKGGVNIPILQNLSIPLPPIYEQAAIVRALKALRAARIARQRELELERERKATLMQHLFTCGTRGETRRQTEVGEIPKSWRVVRFSEAVDVKQGQVNPTLEPYDCMIHVGPENIESGTGRLLATKTNSELNIISGNYLFTEEDVLYSKIRPYLNKVAAPSFIGTCSADMYPLRPKAEFFVRGFLFQLLLSEGFKSRAMGFQDRTGIPKINRNQLGSIPLPVPDLPEQNDIAAILHACDSKISALENETGLLDELFKAMLEELMNGHLSALPLVEAEAA